MKKRGKNNETWWTREKAQWKMMKNRETTMKNDGKSHCFFSMIFYWYLCFFIFHHFSLFFLQFFIMVHCCFSIFHHSSFFIIFYLFHNFSLFFLPFSSFFIVVSFFFIIFYFFLCFIMFPCLCSRYFFIMFHCFFHIFNRFSLFFLSCSSFFIVVFSFSIMFHCFCFIFFIVFQLFNVILWALIRLKNTKTDKIEYFGDPGVTWFQIIYVEAFHCVERFVCWFPRYVYIYIYYLERYRYITVAGGSPLGMLA